MRTSLHAVFLDHPSLDLGDLDLTALKACFASMTLYKATSPEQVLEHMGTAEVVITNKVVLNAQTLAACPNLKLVLIAATGTNNVDLAAAARLGITVCNCQGYGVASVAQHCMMLMLALATRLSDYQRAVANGQWQKAEQFCLLDYPIMELEGKVLGILGYGELGQAVARLAKAFGMQILIGELPGRPAPDRMPLNELLARVDVLSLHCPLTEQTRHLIGQAELGQMKPGALLINTARGGIVDEQALKQALLDGHLGGAATDVLSQEPPCSGNPLLDSQVPRLIITPHCAWGSREARQRIVEQLAQNAQAYCRAQPIRVVA